MSPREVRAVLGAPPRIKPGVHRIGYFDFTYVYPHRLVVKFLLGGDRDYVYSISTTSRRYRTRKGVGVGSSERRVRTYARYCRVDRGVRSCMNTNEGGVGGTYFVIRRGRAVSVTVFAPAF